MHPLDLKSFGWTVGGIVHVDGAKLKEPRHLFQKISQFMHVDPLPNPGDPNRDANEGSTDHAYLSQSPLSLSLLPLPSN